MTRLLENPAANGKVFNIGGSEEASMRTLAERVRTAADSSGSARRIAITFDDLPAVSVL